MKVIIAGAREIDSEGYLFPILDEMAEDFINPRELFFKRREISGVISGCCCGVDSLGEVWAARRGIPVFHEKPDYKEHGPDAPFVRNQKMVNRAMGAFVILAPWSRGPRDLLRRAKRSRLIVIRREVSPVPCKSCGRVLASLLQNMDGNGGRPWSTCLSCGSRS